MSLQFFAHMRQRIGYAASWFGMLGVPLLVVDLIQKKLSLIDIQVSFILLVAVTLVIMALAGYVFEKTGFIQAEYAWAYNMNEKMKADIQGKNMELHK